MAGVSPRAAPRSRAPRLLSHCRPGSRNPEAARPAERLREKNQVSEQRQLVTILVADDDPDDRMLMRDALAENRLAGYPQSGCCVHFVEDGEELMEYLHRRGRYADPQASPLPSLILLDLNMPRKDGREVLMEIDAHPDLRRLPGVVL